MWRSARTFVQAWIGTFLLMVLGGGELIPGTVPDLQTLQNAAIAALWFAVATTMAAFLQNTGENVLGLPILGRKTRPPAN